MSQSWRKLRSVLRRMREVPAGELGLLLWTFILLLTAKAALAIVPTGRILKFRRRTLRDRTREPLAHDIERARWAVLVVARYAPVDFVCFPQCLAASGLLRHWGIASRLHYGVRRGAGVPREAAKLETHTWLEAGGQIVIGGEVAGEFSLLDIL